MKAVNTEPEIITKNGKPVSVILPIKKYQEILERLEDAEDVAWLRRMRRKKLHFRPLEEVLAGLPKRQAKYRVVVERSAEKDLRRLPLDVQFRVVDRLRGLANDPRPVGSRKLAGTKHDWRIRVSDYRVVYEIAETAKIVRVYRVRHRREVYR